MPLAPGARVGAYEVTGTLGAGGMGEVYRARDSKLGRSVAIKVLSPALANDADYIARFEREAQVLASLNHPCIAQIYGLEAGAIVMELVEGPTLADRIAQGPAPLAEALPIAIQIAEALEAAHEQGIVHRDLKPANIKLTVDGRVKVLDFGLAKVSEVFTSAATANSPTLTLRTAAVGTILGTAGYMAPEQAAGKSVDRRADIWAFGVVLWEMLTGRRLFDGETVSHTLADVLRAPIDVNAVPEQARPLVSRCLHRDVKKRLQWIGEARIALEELPETPVAAPKMAARIWPAIAAICLAIAVVSGWGWSRAMRIEPERPLLRFTEALGKGLTLQDATAGPTPYASPAVVISADGKRIVFVASAAGKPTQLYTRRLDEPAARAIEGTEGAAMPFLSPDGQWVGYLGEGDKLTKVRIDGGSRVTLADAPQSLGASWGDDGTIVYNGGLNSVLLRIPDRGGSPQELTKHSGSHENTHRWPQVLPGSKVVIFTAGLAASVGAGTIEAQRLDTGERKTLVRKATFGRYLPSGHLTFVRDGTLFATRFDPASLSIQGDVVPILQDLRFAADSGGAQFGVSLSGTAVYRGTQGVRSGGKLHRVFADGKTEALPGFTGEHFFPTISPDGRKVAVIKFEASGEPQVWVYDLANGNGTRLTYGDGGFFRPRWTPDGKRVLFSGTSGLYWAPADGSAKPVRLVEGRGTIGGMTPDGKTLVYGTLQSCWYVPVSGDPERPVLGQRSQCYEERVGSPELSPDGRWVASGQRQQGRQIQVFVRPFPDRGGKWQVTVDGGSRPTWSPATSELFYVSASDKLMAVPYRISGTTFSVGTARRWMTPTLVGTERNYTVAPDGKSVLVVSDESSKELEPHVSVLLNFFDEVRRRVDGEKR